MGGIKNVLLVSLGLVSVCVCVRWGSVLSSLPQGHPFCTGWTVAARQAVEQYR